jgi:hypothetical protein
MYLLRMLSLNLMGLVPLGYVSVGVSPLGKDPRPCVFEDETVQAVRGKP